MKATTGRFCQISTVMTGGKGLTRGAEPLLRRNADQPDRGVNHAIVGWKSVLQSTPAMTGAIMSGKSMTVRITPMARIREVTRRASPMPRMNSTTIGRDDEDQCDAQAVEECRVDQQLPVVLPAEPDRAAVRDRHVPAVQTEPERIEQRVDGGQQEKEDRRGRERGARPDGRRCGVAPRRGPRLLSGHPRTALLAVSVRPPSLSPGRQPSGR